MLHKFLYKLGVARRNPSLQDYYYFLKDTEKWTKEELEAYQLSKSREFLQFVYKTSPYYKKILNDVGLIPEEITQLSDLLKIPIVTKADLLQNVDTIHADYSFDKVLLSETSGTSGQPLKFYRNEEWDSCNRAAMFRGYSWFGIDPWERNGYFWGYNIDRSVVRKTKILDWLQNRFRLFTYSESEILKFTKKLSSATYLHGYSSMIYEVAKIINTMDLELNLNLKMIKGTSEKIYESYQSEVKKAFGQKIISEYGASESGLIAFECPEGYMHINVENVIVEDVDGEIVVTNLLSRSFPIIRYKLGDSITLADSDFECKCGRKHPVILDVLGRVGKRIIGFEKTYPSLTFYYVFKNLSLTKDLNLNYQAIQDNKGYIQLNIEQAETASTAAALKIELDKYFKDDVIFDIRYGQKLHLMNGKLKDFITTLD